MKELRKSLPKKLTPTSPKKCTKNSSRSQSPSYSLTPENFLSHSKSKHRPKCTTKKEVYDVYDPYVEENVLPPCPSTSECYRGPDEWQIETPTDDTKVGVAHLDGSADENEVDEGNNWPKCTDSKKSKTELSNTEHNKKLNTFRFLGVRQVSALINDSTDFWPPSFALTWISW